MKSIGLITFIFAAFALLNSCNSSKHPPYPKGFTIKAKELECGRIYMTSANTEITRTTFTYGETIKIHFDGFLGFKGNGGYAHPGMELSVTNEKGEKLLYNKDLYSDQDPLLMSQLDLTTILSVGQPIIEDGKYKLKIHIWDKDGKGTFDASFTFKVIKNNKIVNTTTGPIEYSRVYLFDMQGDSSITANKILPGQRVYVIFEGLKGFAVKNGKIKVGMELEITAAGNQRLLYSKDLIGDDLYDPGVITEQAQANFVIEKQLPAIPIKVHITIYDKQSNNKIQTWTDLRM